MSRSNCVVAVLAVLFSLGSEASAGYIVIGSPADANAGSAFPFGLSSATTYQQVYNANQFTSGPITINAIDFFNTSKPGGSINPATYSVYLSTTSKSVNGLTYGGSSSNVGPDNALFFSGALGGPINTTTQEFTITGTPFTYNPANGNLLLEIVLSNATPASLATVFLDARNGDFGTISSRSYSLDSSGSFSNSYGLVTEFDFVPAADPPTVIPEPASIAVFGFATLLGVACCRRRSLA
jgi:hypothetical protein